MPYLMSEGFMGEASGNYLMHSKHEGQPESEKKGQREGLRLKRKGP